MSGARYRLSLLTFDSRDRLRYWPDAVLAVDGSGAITEAGPARGAVRRGTEDLRGLLAIPGLIDAHCHASQYPAVASDGLPLLPWLKTHIFPLERGFKGPAARERARRFFKDMASHGTTTACVFTSLWAESTDDCFKEAEAAGLRVVMGKVMMDRGSYDPRRMSPAKRRAASLSQSEALCRVWHGRAGGRLLYAFTPRFALSCSEELMRRAGELARRYGAYVQTHLSENREETAEARRLFPEARDYTDVYARAGLLGRRSVLAHCVWLSGREVRALASSGSAVAHCPTSNAFLASGIMDLGALRRAGVPAALGSDVGAGPSLCLFEVMRQAVGAQRCAAAHRLFRRPSGLDPAGAFHMATLGGARALGLGGRIGSLERGKEADFVLVEPAAYDPGFAPARDPGTAASRLVHRGSRAAVRAAFVAGRKVWG